MNNLDDTEDDRVVSAVKDYMRMLDAGNARRKMPSCNNTLRSRTSCGHRWKV